MVRTHDRNVGTAVWPGETLVLRSVGRSAEERAGAPPAKSGAPSGVG
jgi:hypothetical protein